MPQQESKAVPEGNGSTPQDAYKIITWDKLRRVLSESMGKSFGEFKEDLRSIDQRLASLEQDARQSRLIMGATWQQTRRLANARRAPLQQFK